VETLSQTSQDTEIPEKAAEAGVVLHQPLNLRIFLDFGKKRQNMNGISVYPGPKTQNAPTWQVENTAREEAIFCNFGPQTTPTPNFWIVFLFFNI